ncbi:DUF2313 domain-containing protein [Salmonella enterica subsp. enterica serovar Agbeni]|nr:DUF2313 domain-containing protein [Salmonella enterica subsp. enterica serovar Agbeni]EHW4351819.1 DUF2313 domain-containing protein [Salmonella enterica subsp. enterica serovar Agbeni]
MAHSVNDWLHVLESVMPRGLAWPRERTAALSRFLAGIAPRLARVETNGDRLLLEMRPETTEEMLPDWEWYLALPECPDADTSFEGRRKAAVEKYHRKGGLEPWRIEEIINDYGFEIRVIEILPHHCLRDCLYPLWPAYYRWTIKIEVEGDESALLECVLSRYRLAGMGYEFIYSGDEN